MYTLSYTHLKALSCTIRGHVQDVRKVYKAIIFGDIMHTNVKPLYLKYQYRRQLVD